LYENEKNSYEKMCCLWGTKGKKRIIDMHRADIRAELEKKGTSLAQLGIENGLSRTTVRNALDKPYPKGEWIIANPLGLNPSDLWPSRYRE